MLTLPLPACVIVIEENHSYDQVIGSTAAPYINSLANQGALMTSMSAVTHPSQPNYLALFSGSTQAVTTDTPPKTPFAAENLGSELIAAGKSFGGYSESMPSVGYTGTSAAGILYARKHNPWSDFSNVPAANNMPLTSFATDFSTLPTVSVVIPNQVHDMRSASVAAGDTWLRANLDPYVEWARTNNSLLIVTFDEGSEHKADPRLTSDPFVGPMVKPGIMRTPSTTITCCGPWRTSTRLTYPTPDVVNATSIANIWTDSTVPTVSIAATGRRL